MPRGKKTWERLTDFLKLGVADQYVFTVEQLKLITGSTDSRPSIPEDNYRYTIGKWSLKGGYKRINKTVDNKKVIMLRRIHGNANQVYTSIPTL